MELLLSEAMVLIGYFHVALSLIRHRESPQRHFAYLAFAGALTILSTSRSLPFHEDPLGSMVYRKASIIATGIMIPLFFRYATSLFLQFPDRRRWIRVADGLALSVVAVALGVFNHAYALYTVFLPGSLLLAAILIFSLYRFLSGSLSPGRYAALTVTIPAMFSLVLLTGLPNISQEIRTASIMALAAFFLFHSVFLFQRFSGHVISMERNRLRQLHAGKKYRRFFPRSFLNHLGRADIDQVNLGDHILKRMSVMFVDIRNFTGLSERLTPLENFRFINGYLGRIGPVIRSHGGFIDKYIGDGILALFPGNECDDALKAAIDIQAFVKVYNSHRKNSGYPPIRVGVGIHAGELMLGIIGESERLQGTVISDAVNLASRLEGLNKIYGSSIIISNEVLIRLRDIEDYSFRILDRVRVKGKEKEVSVIEVMDGEPDEQREKKKETRDTFEMGLIHFHLLEYDMALESFQTVLKANPEDLAAERYVERCNYYMGLMALSET